MNPLIQLNKATPLILVLLAWFGLLPATQAVVPGANTAEGTNALFSLTSGIDNTALGFEALFHNTAGNFNTAEGFRALFSNSTGSQNTATGVNALISNTTGFHNTERGSCVSITLPVES